MYSSRSMAIHFFYITDMNSMFIINENCMYLGFIKVVWSRMLENVVKM